jgi:hypothetical protein
MDAPTRRGEAPLPSPLGATHAALCALAPALRTARAFGAPPRVPRIHVKKLDEATFLREFVAPSRPAVLLGAAAGWRASLAWRTPEGLLASVRATAVGAARDEGGEIPLVTVTLAPNGRADAPVRARGAEGGGMPLLAKPAEIQLPLDAALDALALAAGDVEDVDGMGAGGSAVRAARSVDDAEAGGSAATEPSSPVPSPAPPRRRALCGVPYISSQNSSLSRELPQLLRDVRPPALADGALGGAADAINIWIGTRASVTHAHKDN